MKRLLLVVVVLASRRAFAAAPPDVPPLRNGVALSRETIDVEAGQSWSTRVRTAPLGPDEAPALALRGRVQTPGAGGCNWILQVLVNDRPLTESLLRHRLLNKLPWFDPPGTKYHFRWYNARRQAWMTIFGRDFDFNWGGTGRDFDFLFDLSGLVAGGETAKITFKHTMSYLPRALKRDCAPLVIANAMIGVMNRRDVSRLRHAVELGEGLRPARVTPDLPRAAKPGPRPYELLWSGRKENPPAQAAFDNLSGWTMMVSGDLSASLGASTEQRLWRPRLAKLRYEGGSEPSTVLLRPRKPIPIRSPFDAANMWVFAQIDRRKDRHPRVFAHLEDRDGAEFAIDMGAVRNSYWVLLHGVLDRDARAFARFPMRFVGLSIAISPPKEGPRALYLESLAFYMQNRRPFTENTRTVNPAFPINDNGMLPTPPKGVRVAVRADAAGAMFECETDEGVLRFRVEPSKGALNGVAARWDEGSWFRPMARGEVLIASPAQTAEVISSRLEHNRFVARWSRGGMEWTASYRLSGRTLVVDVGCRGGTAQGLRFGQVEGLADARGVVTPYLTYGRGWGPLIACGRGVFVSVLADWYHCAASRIDGAVPKARPGGVAVMTGTAYLPLTNGRRNDLRDRVLVTVSPEFADVLPSIPNPPSPHRERLAPYMFHMVSHMRPTYLKTLKRYGIDHVIACDFARFYVKTYPEGFGARWRPHPSLTMKQIRDYRRLIKGLGYLFGAYSDLRDYFPLNEFWDENCVSLDSRGDFVEGWYGNFRTKPNYLPVLARLVGEKVRANYPADSVYMDTHTCAGPRACDFEAGVPGAGIARDQVYFNGDCILETKKWYGTVMSEGHVRWMYAGLADMDYASLFTRAPAHTVAPLVDFDLLKIHPLNFGTMMGYGPSIFYRRAPEKLRRVYRDPGRGLAPIEFYQYVSASLAYGHMLMMGYSYLPPLSRAIHLYALMQGVQREYLTDTAAEIRYHDGERYVTTGQALRAGVVKLGRVRVRYSRGLTMHVNYNAKRNWRVGEYELPPFGWLIKKPGKILAYSALVQGGRVDYVRCSEYIYINTGDRRVRIDTLDVAGAVWLKREGKRWRLIPCGDLGGWEFFPPPGLPAPMRDMRLRKTPENRGCTFIAVDTASLLKKPPSAVRVTARTESAEPVQPTTRAGTRLQIVPSAGAVDYLLE